jgi:hypothetical protein
MKGTDKKNLLHYLDISEKVTPAPKNKGNVLAEEFADNYALNQEDSAPTENA